MKNDNVIVFENEKSNCAISSDLYQNKEERNFRNNIKKILLIQPPAFTDINRTNMNPNPPLGIAYIAAVLEEGGFNVEILDAFMDGWDILERVSKDMLKVGLSFKTIKTLITKIDPDLVGITSMFTSQRKNVHEIAEIVKDIDSTIPVIVGGAHPSSATESIMSDHNIDVAVLGEGENTIIPIIRAIESNNEYKNIDGISYRNEQGEIVIIEKITQIKNLDSIPFPARHLLPMDKYFDAGIRHGGYSIGKRAASLITSRGCQYKCNFCTAFKVFTRTPRLRSFENVFGEIDDMINTYGIDEIWFEDDQLFAKRNRALQIVDGLKKYNLIWDTPNGISPWLLNEDIIKRMADSGCYRINLAIESGSQEILDEVINKPVKLKQIPTLVKAIRKYGMTPVSFLVIGNISENRVETIEEIKHSFQFMRKIKVKPHVSLLTAYPGAPVLDIAERKNYLIPNFSWDDLIIQKFQLTTPEWTPEQLMEVSNQEELKTHWFLLFANPYETLGIIYRGLKNPFRLLMRLYSLFKNTYFTFLKFNWGRGLAHSQDYLNTK
jgi:anaerobic magnesium-protoporphyrin IX monomethyl ester cyclase